MAISVSPWSLLIFLRPPDRIYFLILHKVFFPPTSQPVSLALSLPLSDWLFWNLFSFLWTLTSVGHSLCLTVFYSSLTMNGKVTVWRQTSMEVHRCQKNIILEVFKCTVQCSVLSRTYAILICNTEYVLQMQMPETAGWSVTGQCSSEWIYPFWLQLNDVIINILMIHFNKWFYKMFNSPACKILKLNFPQH